jgi:surface protein
VTSFESIFQGCKVLKEINVSSWDVSKAVRFRFLFKHCYNLEVLDCSRWTNTIVDSIAGFAQDCIQIKSLDLSGIVNENIAHMDYAFAGCTNLDVLKFKNLGAYNGSINTINMFLSSPNLGSSPEGLEALRNTLIRDSFDRASAGYSAVTISLPAQVKARLTTDEIAQITAKGFTIT